MNDEEKRKYEAFQYWIQTNTEKGVTTIPDTLCLFVINLIKKLQKENEELRENYKCAQACANMVFDKIIPVQKVKDKIEELNKKIDESIDNSEGGLDEDFVQEASELLAQKKCLQELIERED